MADETEQQLREKIALQKASIAQLPSLRSIVDETGLTSPETKARAQQIKELSDIEEELELLLESRRVEAAVKLQDELYPPENSGDCPICLETIKCVSGTTTNRFYCCGGWICTQCTKERKANCEKKGFDVMFLNKCPLCRERFVIDGKEAGAMVLEHSNKGKAWAQALIGKWCLNKTQGKKNGLSFDNNYSWELIKQAANQDDPDALFLISKYDKNEEMNNTHYLKRAADLGLQDAQHSLGLGLDDEEKSLHYITLAASQGDSASCGTLGSFFMSAECGLTKSWVLAKHYTGKGFEAVHAMQAAYAMHKFSLASFVVEYQRYEGIVDIPGHSPVPTFLFWGRKAVEGGLPLKTKDKAIESISEIEEVAKSRCANCWKEAGCSSFKRCVRCLGAWYCGKECEVQHWKAGHKIDCVSIDRNK